MTVIEADGLARRFGRCEAVGSLTLRVKAGEALCLLGPSGAGKSAALRMLAGRLRPEGGAHIYEPTHPHGGENYASYGAEGPILLDQVAAVRFGDLVIPWEPR